MNKFEEYMRKFFLIYRDRLPDKSQMPSGKSQTTLPHKSQMTSGLLPEAAPIVQQPVAQTPFRLSWSQKENKMIELDALEQTSP